MSAIIPMAMNAGVYWPRNAFWKSSGKIVFEFLPPVAAGMDHPALLAHLEHAIEERSNALMEEAKQNG